MGWGQSTSTKECEFCRRSFEVRDIRNASRLCGGCLPYKDAIDKVRNGKPYSQLTDEDVERVRNKVAVNGKTVNRGNRFNYKQAEIDAQRK